MDLEILKEIKDSKIADYTMAVLDSKFEKFHMQPAATSTHHAWAGGLFEHSVNTAKVGLALCKTLNSFSYDVRTGVSPLNTDIVVAGCVLHDIGKTECYMVAPAEPAGYASTKASKLFHHIPIGFHIASNVAEKMCLEDDEDIMHILHIIISHHGKVEWCSPRAPKTQEAFICHQADMTDAYLGAPSNYRGSFGNL